MLHRLNKIAAIISVLLLMGAALIWARSCWIYDEWAFNRNSHESIGGAGDGEVWARRGLSISSDDGGLGVNFEKSFRGFAYLRQHSSGLRWLSCPNTRSSRPSRSSDPILWKLGFRWGTDHFEERHNYDFGDSWGFVVPLWLIMMLLAPLPFWNARRALLRLQRRRRGLCLQCGYDLRASTGRCPECGARLALPATADLNGGDCLARRQGAVGGFGVR